jgi:hypothetical protein
MTFSAASSAGVVDRGRNSSGSGGTIVFSRSGRLSVIVATASSTSYSSLS